MNVSEMDNNVLGFTNLTFIIKGESGSTVLLQNRSDVLGLSVPKVDTAGK